MLDTLEACKDRIAELTELLGGAPSDLVKLRRALKAKPAVCEIVGFMLKRQYCSRVAIFSYLYGARPECDQPDIKIIDVQMVHVRDALAKVGIKVRADGWGWGSWWLATVDRTRLRAMMKDDEPAPVDEKAVSERCAQRGRTAAFMRLKQVEKAEREKVAARRRAFWEGR